MFTVKTLFEALILNCTNKHEQEDVREKGYKLDSYLFESKNGCFIYFTLIRIFSIKNINFLLSI